MSQDYEQQLESGIDRELKALPSLKAPSTLQSRVMDAIAARNSLPVRSHAKPWSLPARVALFAGLSAAFAMVCYGVLQMRDSGPVVEVVQSSGGVWQSVSSLVGVIQTVLAAFAMAVKHLGTPVLAGLITAALLSYFTLVAIGTVCYRLTFGVVCKAHN